MCSCDRVAGGVQNRDDIPLLAEYFLSKYTKEMNRPGKVLSPEVKQSMLRHPWPGNIRELENAVQRAVALSDGATITVKDLLETAGPQFDFGETGQVVQPLDEEGLDLDQKMADIEVSYLKQALDKTGGNYTKAAQLLKMSLRSFRYKLQKYDIDREV